MKNKKTILYLSYDGITDSLGQSQVLPYLVGLSSYEYIFHLISFEKPDRYIEHKTKIQAICKENEIHWHPQNYLQKGGPIGAISLLRQMNKVAIFLNKIHNFEIVHCRSYIPALVGLKLKSLGVKFIFDMRGFWADERVDGGLWNLNNLLYRVIYFYFKQKEKEFLSKADYVISLTENGKNEILSWNLSKEPPMKIIPCCTDENLFQKNKIKDIRMELGFNKDDFIISYVGSIGTWYMLDDMLDFFKCLRIKKPNAKFLFITKDNPNLILEKVVMKEIDKRAIKIQPSSREMMPSYIGLSDFSIFFILPVFSKKASSPTKMGEIMNLGIPIICNSGVGDVNEIMEKSMPELLIKDFSKKEYSRIVELIIDDFVSDTKKILETAHKYYSLEEGVKKYKQVYNYVLDL